MISSYTSTNVGGGEQVDARHVQARIALPDDVVDDIDRLVGIRHRRRFVEEAVLEKLRRERLRIALEQTAGALKDADIPHWAAPEQTSTWVRELRREGDAATERSLRGLAES